MSITEVPPKCHLGHTKVRRVDKSRGKGWRWACNECPKKGPDSQRQHQLKHRYGITIEEYETMLEAQGGVCAVCGSPPKRKRLHVDHDHETGDVRALLCAPCNTALAVVENSTLLQDLLNYLDTYN
jgi:hypothetical protein